MTESVEICEWCTYLITIISYMWNHWRVKYLAFCSKNACYWWYFKLTVLSTVREVTCPCSINSIDLIWGFLQKSPNHNSSQINSILHCMCEIYMASIKIILLHFNYTSVMNICQVKLQFYIETTSAWTHNC